MPLIQLIVVLIVVGVLLWLVNVYVPMDGKIKRILNIVVVVVVVLWLLNVFGVFQYLGVIKVGHGQAKAEPVIVTCTVDDQNEDRTRTIHCPGFDVDVASWPVVWHLYTSKGEKVQVRVEGEKLFIVAPDCIERQQRRINQECQTGACRGKDPADFLDPDCRPTP